MKRQDDAVAAWPPSSVFIVGMPKSGTSSLFKWMSAHPGVVGAQPKETFFFMDPRHPLAARNGVSFVRDGIESYDQFFTTDDSQAIRVDGTTHYFYQATARDHILGLRSAAFVVFMLREPAERLLSSFRFTRDNLANMDPRLTFNEYVDRLIDGNLEELAPSFASEASYWIAARELAFGRYIDWLDWWSPVGADRIEVVLFEEFRHRPRTVLRRLCHRLGIGDQVYDDFDFEPQNRTYPVARHRLHRLARQLGPMLPKTKWRQRVKTAYLRSQRRGATSEAEYERGLEAMREYFAPSNRDLRDHTGLDLESWWGRPSLHAHEPKR